jgi:fatty-acyl-CoA synthase
MPNFHVGGGVIISLRAVLHGQTVLTLTADGFRHPGVIKNFWGIARRYRMTSLIATPATAAAILSAPNADAEGHCIQTFNCGGSTIPVELLRGFHARFGIWLRELWGMTEIHGMVTIHPDDGTEPVAGSVGRVVPWHQVKAVLVDGDNRFVRECAPGERGVLVIGGVGVIPGYVDPQVDAEFFVTGMPDGKRWANTGDVGTVDDKGFVWIFGRAKDVIIRGGHNIDPKMIEEVLVCHPAVPVEILSIDKMPMTAVGKINKPVLRMQTLQRVAHEVATRVIGSSGHAEVTVDESGLRPRAVIRASVATAEATKIEQALKAAFRDYEFQTSIEIVDA